MLVTGMCVQDELLIFMEYCNEGTLEKVCAEMMHIDLVRRYTRFLILGLLHLHKHNVVHRDIKRMTHANYCYSHSIFQLLIYSSLLDRTC